MHERFSPLFVKCECGTHAFEIQRYDEGDEDKGFYLSFWHYGRINSPMKWKERLRWCWRILRTGDPWADGIIATDETANKISDYITKNLQ